MDQKKALFFLLITLVLFPLYAQQAKDVVLIVDTSSAMFSYYNDVGSYLSGSFFTENLNLGDTLHIISYNNKPRLEIARRILGQGDMEAVSARIWLLYPLFPGPDPFAALNYAVTYVHSIPGGRSKNVFIVSGDDLSAQINAYAARFGAHTDISFIRASYNMSRNAIQHVSASGTNITQGRTGPDSGVLSRPIAETGNMAITTPDMVSAAPAGSPVNTPGKELTDANDVKNEINLPVTVELSEKNAVSSFGDFSFALPLLTAGGILFLLILILAAPKIFLPGIKNFHTSLNKAMADKRTVSGKLQNSRSATVSIKTAITKTIAAKSAAIKPVMAKPNSGTKISVNSPVVKRSGNSSKSLIAFLKILFSKKPRIKNNFPVMRVPASFNNPARPYQFRSETGHFLAKLPIINMFVEEQNTAIGKRNIHILKKGSTYTVGGGKSDFFIFLVPIPPRVGQLYFDGTNCTFTPLKPEFFPDLGSTPVFECIGKPIRIISGMNYEIFFHFERYLDPLVILNQLLTSILTPKAPINSAD